MSCSSVKPKFMGIECLAKCEGEGVRNVGVRDGASSLGVSILSLLSDFLPVLLPIHRAPLHTSSGGKNCPVEAVMPPSTGMRTPVTKDAADEARKAITSATSSGSAQRCRSTRRRKAS